MAVELAETVVPVGFDLGEVTITTPPARIEHHGVDGRVGRGPGRGLMGVTDLGGADGMLFVFGAEGLTRFYMWRTPMPLDIAFFAADGTFVGSAAMEPCPNPSANCVRSAPSRAVPHGIGGTVRALDELGIGPGARLSVN